MNPDSENPKKRGVFLGVPLRVGLSAIMPP
jgi:hypothetical protein